MFFDPTVPKYSCIVDEGNGGTMSAFVPEVTLLLKPLKPLPDEGIVPSPSHKMGAPVVVTSGGRGGERGCLLSSSPSSAETQVEVSCFHGMLMMWGSVLAFLFSSPSKSNTIFLLRSSSRYGIFHH